MTDQELYAGLHELEDGVYRFRVYQGERPTVVLEWPVEDVPDEFDLGDYFFLEADVEAVEAGEITPDQLVYDQALTDRESRTDQAAVEAFEEAFGEES